jgi:hypothetical protein
MNEEMTDDQVFAMYFCPDGQPVRAGVQLSEDEAREYEHYEKHFAPTSHQTITKETDR